MKVAIVHDWLDTTGGAEKVLASLINLYPDADIFSLVDYFSDVNRTEYLKGKHATTSFIQKFPFSRKKFRNYLPFFPLAIEQFDLSGYDLVLSSSHAVAKGVLTGPHQLHVCYQYSPIRYAWDMYHTYFEEHKISGLKALVLKFVLHRIRIWDVVSSNRVDHFVAISTLIRKRIRKFYRRDSEVIFPPVDTERFVYCGEKEAFYLTASRLVPYKKVKLIVEAFNKNGKRLVVAGNGPQYEELRRLAAPNVEILGFCEDKTLVALMQKAKAFIYAAYEDFGIVPVEAMACGTPVIAYGKGGVLDTVIEGKAGLFFKEQSQESLNGVVETFEQMVFDYAAIAEHAKRFDTSVFEERMKNFIDEKMQEFR